MSSCPICGTYFEPKKVGNNEKIYCSTNCQGVSYQRRNPKNMEKARESKGYKEYQRKFQMEYYHKNKQKVMSRSIICDILNRGKICIDKKYCHDCGNITNLRVKIEEFVTTAKLAAELIKNDKIYYLCRKCEGMRRRKVYKCQEVNN